MGDHNTLHKLREIKNMITKWHRSTVSTRRGNIIITRTIIRYSHCILSYLMSKEEKP